MSFTPTATAENHSTTPIADANQSLTLAKMPRSITTSPDPSTSKANTGSCSMDIKIPSVWSANTQACLNKKQVTPAVRREIVHTLSVMMSARCNSLTSSQCERVANAIVLRYPFLADPFGKSQSVSF